jgi:hypothetical protein
MNEKNERERSARASVHSLFQHCMESRNPALTLSRACSKVGYLAGDGVRGNLFHVASALNEQKHAMIVKRHGDPDGARRHTSTCAQELVSFMRGVRQELENPQERLPTPALTQRIQTNLENGQWVRAEKDLGDLAARSDQKDRLPRLDTYGKSGLIREETFDAVDKLIERCNGNVRCIAQQRDPEVSLRAPRSPAEHSLPGRLAAPPLLRQAQEARGLER